MTGFKCRISFKCNSPKGLFFLGEKMNLVKVHWKFFELCKEAGADPNNQLLHNESGRPCVLILKLKYKGEDRDFVVPMKSNVSANTDRNTFFALPPNSRTKPGNYHGIYYVKLFPVHKKYIQPYLIDGNAYLQSIKTIIDDLDNEKEIVDACQNYLIEYENGNKNYYTPNIDLIIEQIDKM